MATRPSAAVRAEQRAWLILWLAFCTFCVLVVAGTRLAIDYVTSAEIELSARVESINGHAFVRSGEGTETRLLSAGRDLLVGSIVQADRPSTVRVNFFDGSRMAVLSEAEVQLVRMDEGRFIKRQTLVIGQNKGAVEYVTVGEAEVQVPHGSVRLIGADATVWVDEQQRTQVLVYQGEARIEAAGSSLLVPANHRGELTAAGRLSGAVARETDLLKNGDFARRSEEWTPIDVQSGPKDVDGQRLFVPAVVIRGGQPPQPAMRIVRESQTQAHGETGLKQMLNVDVRGYRNLYLEAWIRVDRASLSGGGQLGYEYPLMLRVHYEGPVGGSRPDWVQGFYVANPDNRPVIRADQIPAGQWVPFRVNLMEIEDSHRPFRLLAFEVLGQGHTYDSWIADVRLTAD